MPLTSPWSVRQRDLIDWYHRAKRDLPWRTTNNAYAITVSEFMLQQTQVVTVIPYYHRWLQRFPDWAALAAAPIDDVLKVWEGLGYYTRARNLHKLAVQVTKEGGELPRSYAGLLALPGFGPYTAAAVGSIAFGLPAAALDGNVMRVLTRLEASTEPVDLPATRRRLQALADGWLASGNAEPGDHNQAVMELGATVCLPRKSQCLICPLQVGCRGQFDPESYPVKKRMEVIQRTEAIAFLRDESGRLACEQVPVGQAWAGLWRFPAFDPDTMELITLGPPLPAFKYGITKYRVTLQVVEARWKRDLVGETASTYANNGERGFFSEADLARKAMAAPHRKALTLVRAP